MKGINRHSALCDTLPCLDDHFDKRSVLKCTEKCTDGCRNSFERLLYSTSLL